MLNFVGGGLQKSESQDVLFNSMAVTFLYNLDDIGGEMGFLGDDDWDGEELGKLYYNSVSQLMDDKGITEAGFDPDTIAECKYMRNYYSHWAYKVAEPLMYALTVVLPLMHLELYQNLPFFCGIRICSTSGVYINPLFSMLGFIVLYINKFCSSPM